MPGANPDKTGDLTVSWTQRARTSRSGFISERLFYSQSGKEVKDLLLQIDSRQQSIRGTLGDIESLKTRPRPPPRSVHVRSQTVRQDALKLHDVLEQVLRCKLRHAHNVRLQLDHEAFYANLPPQQQAPSCFRYVTRIHSAMDPTDALQTRYLFSKFNRHQICGDTRIARQHELKDSANDRNIATKYFRYMLRDRKTLRGAFLSRFPDRIAWWNDSQVNGSVRTSCLSSTDAEWTLPLSISVAATAAALERRTPKTESKR